jgi:uncharacterized protein (AIM24 family)
MVGCPSAGPCESSVRQATWHVGVSENRLGEIIAVPLQRRRTIWVRQGRFLCATGSVHYRWKPSYVHYLQGRGSVEPEFENPVGRYHLTFTALERQGLLLLHASGDAFVRDLADGESILVRPASLLYWDAETDLSLHLEYAYVPASPRGASAQGTARSGSGCAARAGWPCSRLTSRLRTPAPLTTGPSPHGIAGQPRPLRRSRNEYLRPSF